MFGIILSALLLNGCADSVRSDQMIHWMKLIEDNGIYGCELYGDGEEAVKTAYAEDIGAACTQALESIGNSSALGLLDAVIVPDSFDYNELMQAAKTIDDFEARMPNIGFFLEGNETAEEIGAFLQTHRPAKCDLARILYDNGGVVIPRLDGKDCFVCTENGTKVLHDEEAALAEYLAGQTKGFDLKQIGLSSEFVIMGETVTGNTMVVQLDCLGCKAKDTRKNFARDIEKKLTALIQETGPEPFLLREKYNQLSQGEKWNEENLVYLVTVH